MFLPLPYGERISLVGSNPLGIFWPKSMKINRIETFSRKVYKISRYVNFDTFSLLEHDWSNSCCCSCCCSCCYTCLAEDENEENKWAGKAANVKLNCDAAAGIQSKIPNSKKFKVQLQSLTFLIETWNQTEKYVLFIPFPYCSNNNKNN
jgi:hypothetical protein